MVDELRAMDKRWRQILVHESNQSKHAGFDFLSILRRPETKNLVIELDILEDRVLVCWARDIL